VLAHPEARHRPIPGSGPRRHDTRHHLIAPRACRETSLPASQHYCPGASQGACDALDHAKIAPSTADAATNFLPRSPIRHRLPRPAQPLHKTPPRQIPIVGRPPTRPPAGSFLGGFRTPAAAPGGSVTTGRHPKPFTEADTHDHPHERRGPGGFETFARTAPAGGSAPFVVIHRTSEKRCGPSADFLIAWLGPFISRLETEQTDGRRGGGLTQLIEELRHPLTLRGVG
jgi:hypothetical protein